MRAVAYARFSSDNQREESVAAQLRAIRDYAAKNNIFIVKEYTDEAKSATTDDRPAFQQMISDLRNGLKVDLVLVHKLDRFARNRYDAAVYKREIQKAGARLVAVDQPLDDSPEGLFLEGILESLNEYYSRNLARETLKGMKENAYQAKFNGGWAPFGYRIVNGRYEIDEAETSGVRLIFEWFRLGRSYSEICRELEKRGYKSRRGKPFSTTALHEILRNPKYAGIYVFNRAPRRVGGRRNWRHAKSPAEIIRIPGGVPAIVDEHTWWEVQKLLDAREQGPQRRHYKDYYLTGKVECGACGSPCVGTSRGRVAGGKVYRYYECTRKIRRQGCSNPPRAKDKLEQLVVEDLKTALFADIPALAERLYNLYLKRNEKLNAKCEQLKREIKAIQTKIDKLLDLAENGANPAAIGPRLNDYHTRKEMLERELMQTAVEEPQYTVNDFKDWLIKTRDNLDTERLAGPFLEAVDKIILHPDGRTEVVLKINLSAYNSGVGSGT